MNYRDVYKTVISDRDAVLAFGKFKGKSIAWLMDAEPDYLAWCIENEVLHLSPSLQDEFEQMNPWVRGGSTYGDNRNSGGGYGVWDDSGCHPGDPSGYGY